MYQDERKLDFKPLGKAIKKAQEENRRLCGRSYRKQYLDYICADGMGHLIKPGYVTAAFPTFLKRHGLRKIRLHELRHTYATNFDRMLYQTS